MEVSETVTDIIGVKFQWWGPDGRSVHTGMEVVSIGRGSPNEKGLEAEGPFKEWDRSILMREIGRSGSQWRSGDELETQS